MLLKKVKILVGMSGGVDSSVSAALLKGVKTKSQFKKVTGHNPPTNFGGVEVVGAFIKVWSPDWMACDWPTERREAMRAAAHLKIPFITIDLEKEYKKDVVGYMIKGYKAGKIPNPDVMCNKTIKFGALFDKAIRAGYDYVATGHYARVGKFKNNFQLLAGVDKEKDQSYFLWTLGQKQLSKTVFPVGIYKKTKVREFAKKFKLPNAEKKDSQGLCFIGKVDMADFLGKYIPKKEGNVLNISDEVIGKHSGSVFYTIGQRHGFEVTNKTANDKPLFVVSKNLKKNTITVSETKTTGEFCSLDIGLEKINWVNGQPPVVNKKYFARIRYRQPLQPASLKIHSRKIQVHFNRLQESIAPGQSLVLYDGEICVGGGIIK